MAKGQIGLLCEGRGGTWGTVLGATDQGRPVNTKGGCSISPVCKSRSDSNSKPGWEGELCIGVAAEGFECWTAGLSCQQEGALLNLLLLCRGHRLHLVFASRTGPAMPDDEELQDRAGLEVQHKKR